MKFSIPSVNEIAEHCVRVASRFPFAIIAAVVATISALWLTEVENPESDDYLWLSELGLISMLGISLFLAIQTLSESLIWKFSKNLTAKFFGVFILVLYYFIPSLFVSDGANEVFYRYFLIFLISHLFVAFAPFIKKTGVNEFWEYNKTLFLNFLISALYSAVLFFGLSIALLSIDNLLGFDIKDERYLQLWFVLVGIFNTFFFLAKVPKISEIERSVTEYPKALKVFVQYVLIPIVTIYIIILYSYLIKILVQWELPTGWVANLVLSFSIAGIFSLLLLHPIKDEAKNNWIRLYSRLYYIGLVPLVILLFVSIGTRISEYGVTINRFYVATLAVWLAGIVIYFIVSKSKNIKVIPISLALIALGITFGPLSVFSVSERSQTGRITEILQSTNRLDENEKIISSGDSLSFTQRAEISSIVRYMIDNHDVGSLESLFTTNFQSRIESIENDDLDFKTRSEKVVLLMGLQYVNEWENEVTDSLNQNRYYEFNVESKTGLEISKYDFSFNDLSFFPGTPEVKIVANERVLNLEPNLDEFLFLLKTNDGNEPIRFSLVQKLNRLQKKYSSASSNIRIPAEEMIIKAENDSLSAMMLLHYVNGSAGVNAGLSNIRFTIFLSVK